MMTPRKSPLKRGEEKEKEGEEGVISRGGIQQRDGASYRLGTKETKTFWMCGEKDTLI